MDKKDLYKHRHELNRFSRSFELNECFICKAKPSDSHSIPKQLVLDKITKEEKGNKLFYSLKNEVLFDNNTEVFEFAHLKKCLYPQGKNIGSVFWGFCDEHERLFFPVENNVLFDNSYEHRFLHSFRTFAYDIHRCEGLIKFFKTNNELADGLNQAHERLESLETDTLFSLINKLSSEQLDEVKKNLSLSDLDKQLKDDGLGKRLFETQKNDVFKTSQKIFDELKRSSNSKEFIDKIKNLKTLGSELNNAKLAINYVRDKLDHQGLLGLKKYLLTALVENNYSSLTYEVRFINAVIPIASSFAFNINSIYNNIAITVLPDFNQNATIILLGSSRNDNKATLYMDYLKTLTLKDFLIVISSKILEMSSNTYISIDFFDSFSQEKKEIIFSILNKKINSSKVNLFEV